MNPANSVSFLILALLSIKRVGCWDAPTTNVPSPIIGFKLAIPEGISIAANGSGGHTEDLGQVLETHHTTCQITTEELVATAQATATRVLTGLCNSREMEERFKSLEAQIADLLSALKIMLINLDNKISAQNEVLRTRPRRVQSQLRSGDEGSVCTGPQCPDQGTPTEDSRSPQEVFRKTEEGKHAEDEEEVAVMSDSDGPREEEISRLNNTIHMEPFPDIPIKNAATIPYRVYTYYWRIRGIASKVNSWDSRRSLRSQPFYVTPSGYRMYLLAFPRQNYENLYVHVGITVGANDANLPWPFPLKHRIQLLDQMKPLAANKKRPLSPPRQTTPQDLSSRIWNPALLCSASVWRRPLSGDSSACIGLGYPHDILKSRNYVYDDSIIIKLTVYLG